MIKVYGVPGWGSAISEVMLTLAEIPYSFTADLRGVNVHVCTLCSPQHPG